MSVIAKKLDQVLDRTQKLVKLSKALQEQNDLINLENQSLKVALESSEIKRKEMEEKLRVVKLAKSLEGTSEKTLDIKQKIKRFHDQIQFGLFYCETSKYNKLKDYLLNLKRDEWLYKNSKDHQNEIKGFNMYRAESRLHS